MREEDIPELNSIKVFDNKPYRLIRIERESYPQWDYLYYSGKVILLWRSEVRLYLESTIVVFPGSISFQRLSALVDEDDLDLDIGEEFYIET